MNLYSYVRNNPVRFKDPLGLWYIDIGGNVPVIPGFPFGGFSFDLQINCETISLVPGLYGGTPGAQITVVTGDPTPGPQVTASGGYIIGGSITFCRDGLCAGGLGLSSPGGAVELQWGFPFRNPFCKPGGSKSSS